MLVKTRMLSFGGLAAGASLAVPFWLAAAAGAGSFPLPHHTLRTASTDAGRE